MREIFYLVYHLGMGYEEVRRMPVAYRTWFLQTLQEELTKSKGSDDDPGTDPMMLGHVMGGPRGGPPGRRMF